MFHSQLTSVMVASFLLCSAVPSGFAQEIRTAPPQVAAQGHAHLRVSKHSERDSTHTRIDKLDASGRRDELARMLGGLEITRETRAHAKQMLERAQVD